MTTQSTPRELSTGLPDAEYTDRGAVLLEYGLLITSIALVVMVAVIVFGGSVLDLFESVLGFF